MTDQNRNAQGSNNNDMTHRPKSPSEQSRLHQSNHAPYSPCFIHSRLDNVLGNNRKDSSYFDSHESSPSVANSEMKGQGQENTSSQGKSVLFENSRNNHDKKRPEPRHRGAQGAVEPESDSEGEDGSDASTSRNGSSSTYTDSASEDSEDESDRVRSLTRQLAETAVGVREMSKQLGRARVKSTIQSILIITKARDNHLIKLTRELAIWLMDTPRNGKDTGLIVYVDAQLRQSKRFDAEGIKRDFPHLFAASSSKQQASPDAEAEENGRSRSETSSTTSSRVGSISHSSREESQLRYWTSDMCSRSPHLFDFVVTLGGDGTVLFCSWLFQRIVPPVMPFALGSLGFLTNFDYSDYKKALKSALDNGIRVNLRMRFTATVYRATLPTSSTIDRRRRRAIRSGKTGEIIMRNIQEGGWNRIETPLPDRGDLRGAFTENSTDINSDRPAPEPSRVEANGRDESIGKKDKEVMCFSTRPVETFEVLNDLVVDRGPSPYVSLLEVFGDEHHMTTAQADGLCISTPTGSTAYSLSAGGSLVHPEIPAILITPICPHTLSFRPMLLPDSMELRIAVPYNSRSTAWASFDGRGRVELKQGDHIKVTASKYPFPTICAENQSTDWFESISRTLKWNERQRQKSFVVVEEGDDEQEKGKKGNGESKSKVGGEKKGETSSAKDADKKKASQSHDDDDDDDDDEDDNGNEEQEEEEEAFDIDDTSTAATRASSPDPNKERQQHHHHHRRRSSAQGSGRSSRAGMSSSSLQTDFGSNQIVKKLQPLTSTVSFKDEKLSPKSSTQASNESGTSLNVYRGAQGDEIGNQDGNRDSQKEEQANSEGGHVRPSIYQHGVIQPSNQHLLDSPDRFGLAGPPQPPCAISERHLASADFRLDGGKVEEDGPQNQLQQQPGRAQGMANDKGEKKKGRARSNSKQQSGSQSSSSKSTKGVSLDSNSPSLDQQEGANKSANRMYRKLRNKVKNDKAIQRDGKDDITLDLSKTNSRSGGTALVVYGQDESDSDSTAEG